MSAKNVEPCRVETEFINEWARFHSMAMDLKIGAAIGPLGDGNPDIADVIHVCRTGVVVNSDMLEQRGLWTIVGETTNEDKLELEVAVASEEREIELRRLTILARSSN